MNQTFLLKIMPAVLLCVLATGCGETKLNDKPFTGEWFEEFCGPSSTTLAGAGVSSEAELLQYASENNIIRVNNLPIPYFARAISVVRYHFPEIANQFLLSQGVELRMLYGSNVLQDPKFAAHTTDGNFEYTVGVAYDKYATVFMHEGIINTATILHERAHNLDLWEGIVSKRATVRVSKSSEWLEVMKEPRRKSIVMDRCGSYCDNPVEGFAETFALFHACPRTRAFFDNAPQTVAFMERYMKEVESLMAPEKTNLP